MASCDQTATLLVFTLGPCREKLRKSLLPGGLAAAEHRLHQEGLNRAIEAGHHAGCRVVVAAPPGVDLPRTARWLPQEGDTFGERLRNAVARLQTEKPGSPLVIVGTDVPGLDSRHIRLALRRVASAPDEVVVGPCPDGGFYLLATRLPIEPVLAQVRWCRPETTASLCDALAREGLPSHLIAPMRDLDRLADLEAWLATANSAAVRRMVRWLVALLAELRRPRIPLSLGRPVLVPAVIPLGRAPPL